MRVLAAEQVLPAVGLAPAVGLPGRLTEELAGVEQAAAVQQVLAGVEHALAAGAEEREPAVVERAPAGEVPDSYLDAEVRVGLAAPWAEALAALDAAVVAAPAPAEALAGEAVVQ